MADRSIVDELVTLLTFEESPGSKQTSRAFSSTLSNITDFAVGAGLALGAATAAVGAWTVSLANSVDQGGKFAKSVGVGYEELQEFEFAVKRSGGTVDALRGDIKNLTDSMSSPIPGEFNQELLLLGVSARDSSGQLRSATDILTELAGRFEDFSAQEAQQFGSRLGLSNDTIMLLQQGEEGLAALRREAVELGTILPEDATEKAAEFNDALLNITSSLSAIARQAGVAVLPALTEVVQAAGNFLKANRDIIQSGLETFVNGALQGFRQFGQILSAIGDTIQGLLGPLAGAAGSFDAVDAVATAVTATLIAVGAVVTVLVAKFALIGAAIAAVVIAVEDLIVWFKGGDSAIGRFLDTLEGRFPGVFSAIKGFIVSLGQIFGDWSEGAISRIGAVLDFFTTFSDRFPNITAAITSSLEGLLGIWESTFGAMADAISFLLDGLGKITGAVSDLAGSGITSVLESLEGLFGGDDEAPVQAVVPSPAAAPQAAQGNNNFYISGAGDPRAVATETARRMGINDIQNQIAPGIRAPGMS